MGNHKKMSDRSTLKDWLGEVPLAAELWWQLRQPGRPVTSQFTLTKLQQALPGWVEEIKLIPVSQPQNAVVKQVLIFGTLRWWVEHALLVGLGLAGYGHQVTLAYLPYALWQHPINRFDLRRQNAYARHVLRQAEPLVKVVSFLDERLAGKAVLPEALEQAVKLVSLRDTQYTLQVEQVTTDSDLYRLRLERNLHAARVAYGWLQRNRPEVVVLPNGTILEFGVIYQVARYLDIPVVTYEFGEQHQRIWLAQNAEVMRQQTDALWQARKDQPLTEAQQQQVRQLFAARQRASLWENFARRWQGAPSEGGARVRQSLGLDERPVVLLATNVIGDSLTLGRQVFSDSMTEWLERTVQFFAQYPQAQFVIRIHPGELVTKGPSVADVVLRALDIPDASHLPEHIHMIPADGKVNTYDLVEIADLGLVYTTTVGMEMAMSGVPVMAVGSTHYRGKGFTLDPQTWEGYFDLLRQVLAQPAAYRLSRQQVDDAWHYAYRFFFDYPHPFPWHVTRTWEDLEEWPLERVLSARGQQQFAQTFAYLAGEAVAW
jgi:hypothetical protein